jgi:peptide deformylase
MSSEVAAGHDRTFPHRRDRPRPSEVMRDIGILQLGDPRLTERSRPFDLPAERAEALRVLDRLTAVADEVCRAHDFSAGAMGLAAPQIGEPRSMAVFRPSGAPQIVLINPRIVDTSPADQREWYADSEGCLSFFDFRFVVRRPRRIVLVRRTLTGDVVTTTFEQGRLARDIMHEVDHLGGVLGIDRLTPGDPTVSVA